MGLPHSAHGAPIERHLDLTLFRAVPLARRGLLAMGVVPSWGGVALPGGAFRRGCPACGGVLPGALRVGGRCGERFQKVSRMALGVHIGLKEV